MSETLLQKLM